MYSELRTTACTESIDCKVHRGSLGCLSEAAEHRQAGNQLQRLQRVQFPPDFVWKPSVGRQLPKPDAVKEEWEEFMISCAEATLSDTARS